MTSDKTRDKKNVNLANFSWENSRVRKCDKLLSFLSLVYGLGLTLLLKRFNKSKSNVNLAQQSAPFQNQYYQPPKAGRGGDGLPSRTQGLPVSMPYPACDMRLFLPFKRALFPVACLERSRLRDIGAEVRTSSVPMGLGAD